VQFPPTDESLQGPVGPQCPPTSLPFRPLSYPITSHLQHAEQLESAAREAQALPSNRLWTCLLPTRPLALSLQRAEQLEAAAHEAQAQVLEVVRQAVEPEQIR